MCSNITTVMCNFQTTHDNRVRLHYINALLLFCLFVVVYFYVQGGSEPLEILSDSGKRYFNLESKHDDNSLMLINSLHHKKSQTIPISVSGISNYNLKKPKNVNKDELKEFHFYFLHKFK